MSFTGLGTRTHCANSRFNGQVQQSYIRPRASRGRTALASTLPMTSGLGRIVDFDPGPCGDLRARCLLTAPRSLGAGSEMSDDGPTLTLQGTGECITRDKFRKYFMKRFYDPAYRVEKQVLMQLETKVWYEYTKIAQPLSAVLGRG